MKIFLQIILPPLLAIVVWVAINRDEQRRLWLFLKAIWEEIDKRLYLLWETRLRTLIGSGNRPALVSLEVDVVDGETSYQGKVILETANYFTLKFIFQPPSGQCTKTHWVDIAIADWKEMIHHQDRVSFCCGRDRRWIRFCSQQYPVAGRMAPGHWSVRYSLDGEKSRGIKFQVVSLNEVFTPDGGIVDIHSRSFGQKL